MGRRPQNPLQALADAARDQLQRARALGRSLDKRIKIKQEASEEFTMDEDARRDFAAISAGSPRSSSRHSSTPRS
jgi:hypothetical protein